MINVAPSSYLANKGEATPLPPVATGTVPSAVPPSLSVASPPSVSPPVQLAQARLQGANALGDYSAALLSPEEQRGIMQSATGALGVLQQGEQVRQQAREQNFMQDFRNRELALRRQKTESDMRGDTAQSALIQEKINELQFQRQMVMQLPEAERPYAALAPSPWAYISSGLGRGGVIPGGEAKSEKVRRVQAIAAAKGISEDAAWDIVNKEDEFNYVEDTIQTLMQAGHIMNVNQLPAIRKELQRQYREEIRKVSSPTTSPAVSENWQERNKRFGY